MNFNPLKSGGTLFMPLDFKPEMIELYRNFEIKFYSYSILRGKKPFTNFRS